MKLRFIIVSTFFLVFSGDSAHRSTAVDVDLETPRSTVQHPVPKLRLADMHMKPPLEGVQQAVPKFRVADVELESPGRTVQHPILQSPIQSNETIARNIGATDARADGVLRLNLTGSGITIGLWDIAPPRITHTEFETRVTYADPYSILADKHATNMSGTAVASGVNTEARGIAPEAALVARISGDNREIASMAAAAADGLRISFHPYAYPAGWLNFGIDTNSRPDVAWTWAGTTDYSPTQDYVFGHYAPQSASWDEVAADQPHFLMVKAAGNQHGFGPTSQPLDHWVFDFDTNAWVISDNIRDLNGIGAGYSSLSYASLSKNVLTVGSANLTDGIYTGPSSVVISERSGRGPADDGRIKPDLVALSNVTVTPSSGSDTDYSTAGGTSSASAVTAGAAALALQLYRRHFDAYPLSSTYKALFIHTADQTGADAGPDYTHGYGLLNVAQALTYLDAAGNQSPQVLLHESVYNASSVSYELYHDGRSPFKATLAWTDPPGQVISSATTDVLNNRTPALVHDLDLRVTSPDGSIWQSWKLNPDHPESPATRGDNSTDNVEQILAENAPAGHYTITIQHKGSIAAGGQSYSLVAGPARIYARRYDFADAGWRLISAPHPDLPYSALNDYFFTQGGPGSEWATNTGNASNLWQFNAATASYEPVPPEGGHFESGRGYLIYMFAENPSGMSEKQWLPTTWYTHGAVAEAVDADLDETLDWYLAGNPYERALDWSGVYTASDGVLPGIAVWNPAGSQAAGSSGDQSGFVYRSAAIDLGDGDALIAPYTGFFVERDAGAESSVLRFRRDQMAVGEPVEVFGRSRPPVSFLRVGVRPTGGVASGDGDVVSLLWLIWHEDARAGRDRLDIARVASPGGDGFSVTSMVEGAGLVWDVRSEVDFDGGEVLMRVCGVPGGTGGLEVWVEGSAEAWLSVAGASGGGGVADRSGSTAGAGTGALGASAGATAGAGTGTATGAGDAGTGATGTDAAVVGGGVVRVEVADLPRDEDGCMLLPAQVTSSDPVAASIRNDSDLPQSVTLSAPYPNPFNPSTRVTFELASPAPVRLRIVDVLGRPVQILADGWHESGRHNYTFEAGKLAAGMYLIVLESPYGTHTRSVTLIK